VIWYFSNRHASNDDTVSWLRGQLSSIWTSPVRKKTVILNTFRLHHPVEPSHRWTAVGIKLDGGKLGRKLRLLCLHFLDLNARRMI